MKKYLIYILVTIFISSFFKYDIYSQPTKIRGKIIDNKTKETLPFVNITFKGTTIGTITDENGNYFIQSRTKSDTIIVSYVGYKTQKRKISIASYQNINFELESSDIALNEIVVLPGKNPAHRILRKIISNKKKNNPAKLNAFSYEFYNKLEFDISNVDEKFKKKKVFKKFQFIFDYIDTSVVTGKSYLPVLITETVADYHFQRRPRKEREIVKASKISGIKNTSIAQFTGEMYLDANIYDNFMPIFEKSFISPIANFGLLTYKYYLIDSMFIDKHWCYQISFKPRRKQELTFTGDFWVADSSFAIVKVKGKIATDANINFVNNLVVEQEFTQINDSIWFYKRNHLFIDFNLGDKSTGLFGRKTTSYKNIKIGKINSSIFETKAKQETIFEEGSTEKDSSYWNNVRHIKLSKKEKAIYNMVDSIKNVPVFNTIMDVITFLFSGYYETKYFEFGPYPTFYSFNEVEGSRIRIGGRTSNTFSKKIMLNTHIAYGTKDEKFKFGAGFLYMLKKNPRKTFGYQYLNDIEQLGQSDNLFFTANILSSLLVRNPIYKLTYIESHKLHYEHEWYSGFSNTLYLKHRQIFSTDSVPFIHKSNNMVRNRITTSEIKLNTRYAYNEKFISGEFDRVSIGTEYPILNLDITMGIPNLLESDYEYYKFEFSLRHYFEIPPFGWLRYIIKTGKLYGNVPYPLLHLHNGNETYAFDINSFNMMNYYEFASDIYASLYIEHHLDGFFLNKIPLFRKLKLREIIYWKGVIGRIESKPEEIMDYPVSLSSFGTPYFEGGFGIENIFKFIRIDAIWRFSYLDKPDIQIFGIRAKLQIIF